MAEIISSRPAATKRMGRRRSIQRLRSPAPGSTGLHRLFRGGFLRRRPGDDLGQAASLDLQACLRLEAQEALALAGVGAVAAGVPAAFGAAVAGALALVHSPARLLVAVVGRRLLVLRTESRGKGERSGER